MLSKMKPAPVEDLSPSSKDITLLLGLRWLKMLPRLADEFVPFSFNGRRFGSGDWKFSILFSGEVRLEAKILCLLGTASSGWPPLFSLRKIIVPG